MNSDSRRFLRNSMLFLAPFILFGAAMFFIDPFNYFGHSPLDDTVKKEISFKLNYAMWKMYEFNRDPVPNILLGDSRMMELNSDDIRELTGREFYNFAYGGGSLKEAIATYHFASSRTHLDEVIIGLDLNSYNGSDLKDRVTEVTGTFKNPFLYLTNNTTAIAAWKIMRSMLTGKVEKIGQPIGDRDAFWHKQLEITARVYFANYRDPATYRSQLKSLAAQCRRDGTRLTFIIFPSHKDLMDKIRQYDLVEKNRMMKEDLSRLGVVYDFAWESPVTESRANFKDPYHFTEDIAREIIRTVWGGKDWHVHKYGLETPPGPSVTESNS